MGLENRIKFGQSITQYLSLLRKEGPTRNVRDPRNRSGAEKIALRCQQIKVCVKISIYYMYNNILRSYIPTGLYGNSLAIYHKVVRKKWNYAIATIIYFVTDRL